MQLSLKEQNEEREKAEILSGMMGGDVDPDTVLLVLRKHKGDLQKAADAILSGDRGEETLEMAPPETQVADYTTNAVPATIQEVTQAPSNSVIDLTGEDEEYQRVLKMSLESSQTEPKFGPSERAPDPAWQMVSSSLPVANTATQEDHNLNEAIQASLNEFVIDDMEDFPIEQTCREMGRPAILRSQDPSLAYAALIIHALYFVPQVRAAVASLRMPDIDPALPRDSPVRAIYNLTELFAHLDLAHLATIVDAEAIPSLEAKPCTDYLAHLSEDSANLFRIVALAIERYLYNQKVEGEVNSRLCSFIHGQVEFQDGRIRRKSKGGEGNVVMIEIGTREGNPRDLVSCLSASLSRYEENNYSTHDVINELSEVVAFHLKHIDNKLGGSKSSTDAFVYPKSIFLDQFLEENAELVYEKRAAERAIAEEIKNLTERKEVLTRYNNRNTLKDLDASVYYYENIADTKDDPDRKAVVESMAAKLKGVLATLVTEINEIDIRIEKLKADSAVLFDCPELRQHQYDLRAVLMHTGLPGRKQIYSYVQDSKGTWWKMADYTIAEVPEETVLTDSTGLHLNAGPYMAIYSQHLTDEQLNTPVVWPKVFTDVLEDANRTFSELEKAGAPHSLRDSSSDVARGSLDVMDVAST